jgi:hypothetical protein
MSAQEDTPWNLPPQRLDRGPKPLLIALRAAPRRWPARARLPERKVTAQHGKPRGAEGIRECDEKRRIAVGSRTVSEHEPTPGRGGGNVKESANPDLSRSISELSNYAHTRLYTGGGFLSANCRWCQ